MQFWSLRVQQGQIQKKETPLWKWLFVWIFRLNIVYWIYCIHLLLIIIWLLKVYDVIVENIVIVEKEFG